MGAYKIRRLKVTEWRNEYLSRSGNTIIIISHRWPNIFIVAAWLNDFPVRFQVQEFDYEIFTPVLIRLRAASIHSPVQYSCTSYFYTFRLLSNLFGSIRMASFFLRTFMLEAVQSRRSKLLFQKIVRMFIVAWKQDQEPAEHKNDDGRLPSYDHVKSAFRLLNELKIHFNDELLFEWAPAFSISAYFEHVFVFIGNSCSQRWRSWKYTTIRSVRRCADMLQYWTELVTVAKPPRG